MNNTVLNIGESINVQKITFINNSLGFACGGIKQQVGRIYKTIDGGTSWQNIYSASENCIYDIAFVNDSLGFACGENLLLLKTTDGGQTWVNQHDKQGQPPSSFNSTLRNIFCVDDKYIYIAGGNGFEIGLTYKTYDGGGFWIYNTFNNELRSVYFKDKYTGFFSGYGTVLKTIDSAHSFNPVQVENDFFVSMAFPTADIGYCCGYNGGIYKTSNAGSSWEEQHKRNNDIKHACHFNELEFYNTEEGYAVGNNGLVVFTNDGGKKWQTIKKFTDNNLYSIAIKNLNEIFITSTNGNIYLLKP